MIKFVLYIVIYINHNAILKIIKQIIIIISLIVKLNLRLIRVSKYMQKFRNLKFRYKLRK